MFFAISKKMIKKLLFYKFHILSGKNFLQLRPLSKLKMKNNIKIFILSQYFKNKYEHFNEIQSLHAYHLHTNALQ